MRHTATRRGFFGILGAALFGPKVAEKTFPKVWIDPNLSKLPLVMEYKGQLAPDVGFFYCPYIPITKDPHRSI